MKTTAKFTVLHRTLHWVMALAMMILFATGFLRMTWMSKSTVVSVLSETAETKSLLKDQMVGIAKSIQAPMWEWHELFAHIMIITIVVRIVYMLTKGIRFPKPFGSGISVKERLQGMVCLFLCLRPGSGSNRHHYGKGAFPVVPGYRRKYSQTWLISVSDLHRSASCRYRSC